MKDFKICSAHYSTFSNSFGKNTTILYCNILHNHSHLCGGALVDRFGGGNFLTNPRDRFQSFKQPRSIKIQWFALTPTMLNTHRAKGGVTSGLWAELMYLWGRRPYPGKAQYARVKLSSAKNALCNRKVIRNQSTNHQFTYEFINCSV